MNAIGIDDIEDLALGAVVLGAGGGGDPHIAMLMLRQAIEKSGPVQVVHPDDLDPEAAVFPIAMVGAPTVVVEKFPSGAEFEIVLRELSDRVGTAPAAVVALESGGLNALFPLAVAAELGLPCVWINRLDESSDLPRAGELPNLSGLPPALDALVPR